jgi:hypothetical protein
MVPVKARNQFGNFQFPEMKIENTKVVVHIRYTCLVPGYNRRMEINGKNAKAV